MSSIIVPDEFGGSWSAFCSNWCPEGSLAYSAIQISAGLTAVKRLWPEKLAETVDRGGRGTWAAAVLVDAGLMLLACESAQSFTFVLRRLRLGQRAAYSEVVVGASIVRLGSAVKFEAGPGEPDLRSTMDDVEIAFEVYAPDRSQNSADQRALVNALQRTISTAVTRCRVEIAIIDTFSALDIKDLVETIRGAPSSAWTFVGNWARVRRIDEGQGLAAVFDGDGAQVEIAGDSDVKGGGTSTVIRWEESDNRAERSLENKRAQVREGAVSIVAMDVCAVGGVAQWPEVISRLRGVDYSKIAAVVFFDQGVVGPPEAVRRRWRVVENPHSVLKLPARLLSHLESLDESTYWGIPSKGRLAMM
jgi:hypothetical protein